MVSYTPRTDAETYVWQNGEENPFVQKEFARQLERELAASKAEVERLKEAMISCLHITNCYDGNYAKACDNVELIVRNALKVSANSLQPSA